MNPESWQPFQRYTTFNGEPFDGKLQLTINTNPPIPLEDLLFGRFNSEETEVKSSFSLVGSDGSVLCLHSGTITVQYHDNGAEYRVISSDFTAKPAC